MEEVNRDRVGWAPDYATTNTEAEDVLGATAEGRARKNREEERWLLESVVNHWKTSEGATRTEVNWQGD